MPQEKKLRSRGINSQILLTDARSMTGVKVNLHSPIIDVHYKAHGLGVSNHRDYPEVIVACLSSCSQSRNLDHRQ